MSAKSRAKLNNDLGNSSKAKFNKKAKYEIECECCGKVFSFTGADVTDNVVKCSHCNSDNVVFLSQFKMFNK